MESFKDIIETQKEQEAEKQILDELRDLTNNQVYDNVYRKRLLTLKRGISIATDPREFLGSNGREVMIPSIKSALNLIYNSKERAAVTSEFHMLDVGAGAGEPFDWFFAKEFREHKEKISIYAIETNPEFIELYKKRIKNYNDLFELKMIYNGKIQDYYDEKFMPAEESLRLPLPTEPLEFINCMHMIYYLTDYNAPQFDPYSDIKKFVKFLYKLLRPGGSIYIVYVDPLKSFVPINSLFYKEILKNTEIPSRMVQTLKAREDLLYNKQIISTLQETDLNSSLTGKTRPRVESHKDSIFYYAKTLADLAAIGLLAGELMKSDEEVFDIRMLESSLDKLKSIALQDSVDDDIRGIRLERDSRYGEDVWKFGIFQVACIIHKESI